MKPKDLTNDKVLVDFRKWMNQKSLEIHTVLNEYWTYLKTEPQTQQKEKPNDKQVEL